MKTILKILWSVIKFTVYAGYAFIPFLLMVGTMERTIYIPLLISIAILAAPFLLIEIIDYISDNFILPEDETFGTVWGISLVLFVVGLLLRFGAFLLHIIIHGDIKLF